MTLLVREIGRFLLGTVAWIGVEAVIAIAAAWAASIGHTSHRGHHVGITFIGAVVMAAAAVRVSAPLAWAPIIGGRPLPVGWSALGAAVAAVVVRVRETRIPATH